jgi:di/tricarboxylate transporter
MKNIISGEFAPVLGLLAALFGTYAAVADDEERARLAQLRQACQVQAQITAAAASAPVPQQADAVPQTAACRGVQ